MNDQTPEAGGINRIKQTAEKIINLIIQFVIKHKLVFAIVLLVVMILVALFNVVPVISINDTKLVNLNTSVRIESGQTVKLKGDNVSVFISNFANAICPKGRTCFGSGPTVEYKLVIDGRRHSTGTKTPADNSKYQVETSDTDYKTYAVIKIVKS